MIFDTHAHYDDSAFDEDREELLKMLPEKDIHFVVNAASGIESTKATVLLTEDYPYIYGTAGVHPEAAAELDQEKFKWLNDVIRNRRYSMTEKNEQNKIVAVGEIGLDYYWKEPEPKIQKYWFLRQLKTAVDYDLPVVIHSRDAAADTLSVIREAGQYAKVKERQLTGVIHCFSYGMEIASRYLDMGFYLGIGGVATFKNAKKLIEVIKHTPIERIVIETDSPYLSPEPNRGKRNTSMNLPFVIEKIAELKQLDQMLVMEQTYKNAINLYRI